MKVLAAIYLPAIRVVSPFFSAPSCSLISSHLNREIFRCQRYTRKPQATQLMSMSQIPSPPFRYLSEASDGVIDLTALDYSIMKEETEKQDAYDLGSQIKKAMIKCRASYEQGRQNDIEACHQRLEDLIAKALPQSKKVPRKANLSFVFGDYVRQKAYYHFLSNGALLPQSSLSEKISDEEYLTGIITMNQDIARYAIGRATERDVNSVMLSRDLISSILDHLMKYDFRNGHLRRKYDGVKYALKTTETVLYELSVTGADIEKSSGEEHLTKKSKPEDSDEINKLLPEDELEHLRKRMEHRDELREKLIKRCRDGQKAAKQAIYALHRDDIKKASQLISDCEKNILEQLMPIVEEEPTLRYGSYSNVLEEYAEAKLYFAWLLGKSDECNDRSNPVGVLLLPEDFNLIPLQVEDYIGGLCDLTGEIGRYAVKKGTLRDAETVRFCLETDMSIIYALESLSRLPGGNIGKKMEPLRRSIEKLEKMLYELSLVKATGRNVVSEANDGDPGKE